MTLAALLLAAIAGGCIETTTVYEEFGSARLLYKIKDAGNRVQFSPDGKLLLTTFADTRSFNESKKYPPRIWQASDGNHLRDLEIDERNPSLHESFLVGAFHPDGSVIARGWFSNQGLPIQHILVRWNPLTGAELDRTNLSSGSYGGLTISPDGETITLLEAKSDIIYVFDGGNMRRGITIETPGVYGASSEYNLSWSPDSRWLMAADDFMIDMQAEPPEVRPFAWRTRHAVFVGNNHLLLGGNSYLTLVDRNNPIDLGSIPDGSGTKITAIAVSPDYTLFASASDESGFIDGRDFSPVTINRISDGATITVLNLPQHTVTQMSFDPTSSILAIADERGEVRLYEITLNN